LPTQEEQVHRARARDRLAALLDGLDDDKRAVFVLYEIEQLSMREVSDVLRCPLQTCYSRLKAAHKIIREANHE
jgi:RNA polymerase sigma-70 factor (ECF subfamily)